MAINEYGKKLQQMDNVLYAKNAELAEALSRNADGHIMMSPNLDGNIAENMIAKTTELSASLQDKNISVSVLESHAANSVDVRAINHDTGQYQNYQLKFGKDAKATIELLERGNYNNQRIIGGISAKVRSLLSFSSLESSNWIFFRYCLIMVSDVA